MTATQTKNECFNCGATEAELRREIAPFGREIGGGCPLCKDCWSDLIDPASWQDAERISTCPTRAIPAN